MNRKERREIARKIAKLDTECEKGNNISENMAQMEKLVSDCSIEDLLRIDEIIMKKFLTNWKFFGIIII